MRAPYGFELSENCHTCQFRRDGFFCQLSPAELSDFDAIKSILACPANFVLFAEGHRARGFFQLCQGDVRLFLTSREGHTVALRTAWPGDVIGLWAALSGGSYEATAEAIQPC